MALPSSQDAARCSRDDGAADGAATSKHHQKWKRMMQRGIGSFMRDSPENFRRRVRRGIPMEYRWEVWKAAAGTAKKTRPGLYQELLQQANQWTRLIEIDIPRTFPEIPLFDTEQQQSLLRILHAYANLNPDVGYCQGMNFVAGLLLYVGQNEDFRQTPRLEQEEETFWVFACLMEEGRLSGFYKRQFPLLRRYLWAFDALVAEELPDLRDHFARENVQHAVYLHQWFLTLYINCLPLPMVLIFWDVIVCGGLELILPITVSLLRVLKDALMELQFEDIVRFFKTMRASEEQCDAKEIGRFVLDCCSDVIVPERVTGRIREEDDAPLEELSPRCNPPKEDSSSASGAAGPGSAGSESEGYGADVSGTFQLSGYLTRSFTDIGRDFPQGVLSWWEDARDSLQRVGLGVPSRETAQVSGSNAADSTGSGGANSGWGVGPRGRQLRVHQK